MGIGRKFGLLLLVLVCGWQVSPAVAAPEDSGRTPANPAPDRDDLPFATVGDQVITGKKFREAMQEGVRQKYYHSKVPENELPKFQREIGDKLIDRTLLLQEAKRRGLTPNQEAVKKTLDGYDARYKDSKPWQENRDKMIPALRQELEDRDLLAKIEKATRDVPPASPDAVRAYYDAHPDKFTAPMDQKISVIMLKVDPGAGGKAWEEAMQKSKEIAQDLKKGADFAEMARRYSQDPSAANGGKMKFIHRGMLADTAQAALDKIKPGEITDPVLVLEGVAIMRLDAREMPEKMPFEKARERASKRLAQEDADKAWDNLKKELRAKTKITLDTSFYLPLPKEGEGEKEADQAGQTGKGEKSDKAGKADKVEKSDKVEKKESK
ncbi:MAG: peptidylprolyl isomerase [Magnetococcus sp. DMHC-1]|nr:peptidylprolyl isomerase [Magnetococcales bacterium]